MTLVLEDVSIRAKIREVLANSDYADPYDCVDAVVDSIDERDYRAYLRDAIAGLISTVASTVSRQEFHRAISGGKEGQGPRVEIQLDPITLEERRIVAPAYSHKRELIRQYHEQFLNSRMNVETGRWVFWRDVTVDDLRLAAEKRRARAESLTVEANKYDTAADIMLAAGVSTIGELAETDLRSIRKQIEA